MSKLVTYLAEYLSQELLSAIESSPEDSLRVVFSAPPKEQLSELFKLLTEEHGEIVLDTTRGTIQIPVYLVDPDAKDNAAEEKVARCTPDQLVGIRNNDNIPRWIALHEIGATMHESTSSTVNPLGISKEVAEFNQWVQVPVVDSLVKKYIFLVGLTDTEEYVEAALIHALRESWDADERFRDKRSVWQVFKKIFEMEKTSEEPHVICAATLGLPSCSKAELGRKDHLSVISRLSDLFQSHGLRKGFVELEDNADKELLPHLREMRRHIEKQGVIEANEFARNPLLVYSPINDNESSIPAWWRALTINVWAELLDARSRPADSKLDVNSLNAMTKSPSGMPTIVSDSVELKISIGDADCAIEVIITRSNGNAALVEVAREIVDPNSDITYIDNRFPNHERFIRYKVEAVGYTAVLKKFIVLNSYAPGVVALSPGSSKATPFKINKKAKDSQNKSIARYESDLHLPGMGSHYLELLTSNKTSLDDVIRGYEVDSEHSSTIERQINKINTNHYSCLIETDEECHYEFTAYSPGIADQLPFRIYVTADESKQTGANSEFDRLIIMHRAAVSSEHSSARVDPLNCRAMNLEMWMLEDEQSFRPIVLGPDYLEYWSKPDWSVHPLLSGLPMLVDPRPTKEEFVAPLEFLNARKKILSMLGTSPEESTPTASTLQLHEFMRDTEFKVAMGSFLQAYLDWLESDYDQAMWADVVSIHAGQSNAKGLDPLPYAIMLSPFHPVRLAWQCCAQSVLQDALNIHARCPAASMMSPISFPDCLVLPCITALGSIEHRPFAAMTSSSDYWSVLLSVEANGLQEYSNVNTIFGDELGINIDGLAGSFSSQQVVRSLDEVSRLMSAKSTLRVGVSSDTGGTSSCNEGIDTWCSANLGSDEDSWQEAGPRSVYVVDQRERALQPEPAGLASLTSRTDAAVRWFTGKSVHGNQKNDLSIIAHLGTMNHSFGVQSIRSAIDLSALSRWRVRKQLHHQNSVLIAESRIGEIPSSVEDESIAGKMLCCVDKIERQCRDKFDSYIFAPDMVGLAAVVDKARYTALSSSNVDAACFFGSTDKAYLWDYELPSYARRAGENTGYYLLAKESPGMLHAVKYAIELLGDKGKLEDGRISSLLAEISRRGMPTLKRLTTGGSMSLGEVGMLTALRIFQSEFEDDSSVSGILPVIDNGTLNLIVSADPFQNHFDDLRSAIGFKHGERPDLLVMSTRIRNNIPIQMRLTPVEVKARRDSMSPKEKNAALTQATNFADFLKEVQEKAKVVELWGLAWRNFLATILDYGFRVYGQLDQFMKKEEWALQHSAVLRSIANNDLLIEVDSRGRLIIIDESNSTSRQDLDNDGFSETIRLSHAEAFLVLAGDDAEFAQSMNTEMGDWDLKPAMDPKEEVKPELENDVVTTIEQPGKVEAGDNQALQGLKFPVGNTINQFTSEEVYFFPSNTALNQLNVGIVGDLGTGKTQLIQSLIKQLISKPSMNRGEQPNILIFDYKRDYSNENFVKATGASVISPFELPLNLFDIRDSSQKRNAWLDRSRFFIDVLNKIYTGIGAVQKQRIKAAVKESYRVANDLGRLAPTINDVFETYKKDGATPDTPYTIMDDLVDGEYFVSETSDVIPFSEFLKGVVVIDLSEVGQDDQAKNMLVAIFLNLFYEHMLKIKKKAYVGEEPKLRFIDTMLLVDEADNIMRYEFDVLKKILLQGREFGVGVLLASQYLSHYKTSHENYLEPLLTWFIHKVPNISVKDLEQIGLTGVSADLVDEIKSMNCHECLYKTLGVDGKIIRATPFFELPDNT